MPIRAPETVSQRAARDRLARELRACAPRGRSPAARRSARPATGASGRRGSSRRAGRAAGRRAGPPRRAARRAARRSARSSASALTVTSRRSRSCSIAGGAHVGQRARARVRLGARRGEIPAAVAGAHGRGAEALVRRAARRRRRAARRARRRRPRRRRRARAATGPAAGRAPRRRRGARRSCPPAASSSRRPQGSSRRRWRRSSMRDSLARRGRHRAGAAGGSAAPPPASTIAGVSPSPRGERPLPRLAIGAVLLVLCVAVGLVVFDRKRRRLQSGRRIRRHERGHALRDRQAPRADGHPADDGFNWPVYGYSKARTHHLPLRRAAAAAVPAGLGAARQRAARVLAGPLRPAAVPAQEQRRAVRDLARDRPRELEAQARLPRRRLAGLRRRHDLRGPAQAHRAGGRPGGSSPCGAKTGARAGRASCPAARSPRR